ncbi:hypothetical protein WJX73_009015 [Symbiochloris irregularis]|uniref:Uncharacterized protein n=1 Tax=Symbiochloris irregularis TaxID=706552 RepID=A0AAW1NNW4_9CHLO
MGSASGTSTPVPNRGVPFLRTVPTVTGPIRAKSGRAGEPRVYAGVATQDSRPARTFLCPSLSPSSHQLCDNPAAAFSPCPHHCYSVNSACVNCTRADSQYGAFAHKRWDSDCRGGWQTTDRLRMYMSNTPQCCNLARGAWEWCCLISASCEPGLGGTTAKKSRRVLRIPVPDPGCS